MVTWAEVSVRLGRLMAAKSAARSARGSVSVPVRSPEPLPSPAISSGPTSNGPLARQSSFRFSAPSPPIRPMALTSPAAPARLAWPTSATCPSQVASPFRCGAAPSSRSNSPMPLMKSLAPASRVKAHGLSPLSWVADQLALISPLAPARAAARLEKLASPLKLRPPKRPVWPSPVTFSPGPSTASDFIRRRPSGSQLSVAAPCGREPSNAASNPLPCPPCPVMSAVRVSALFFCTNFTGPRTWASA